MPLVSEGENAPACNKLVIHSNCWGGVLTTEARRQLSQENKKMYIVPTHAAEICRVINSNREGNMLKESRSHLTFETIHNPKMIMPDDNYQILLQAFRKVEKQSAVQFCFLTTLQVVGKICLLIYQGQIPYCKTRKTTKCSKMQIRPLSLSEDIQNLFHHRHYPRTSSSYEKVGERRKLLRAVREEKCEKSCAYVPQQCFSSFSVQMNNLRILLKYGFQLSGLKV